MKTPEEIKKGLKLCSHEGHGEEIICEHCPYDSNSCAILICTRRLSEDALTYIRQLEAELEAVKRERDAAVADIKTSQCCSFCIHCPKDDECTVFRCMECDKVGCVCRGCFHGEKLEWRGVCPENTEVQDEN